jgi:hypothetical protein
MQGDRCDSSSAINDSGETVVVFAVLWFSRCQCEWVYKWFK